jgi:hypothetical protein
MMGLSRLNTYIIVIHSPLLVIWLSQCSPWVGHRPLALLALALSVYLTTCSHLLWPLLLTVEIQQLSAMLRDGEYL